MPDLDLSLGQRVFFQALQEFVKEREDLVKGARVSYKRNAAGDLVLAVIVPGDRLPPATRENKKARRESR